MRIKIYFAHIIVEVEGTQVHQVFLARGRSWRRLKSTFLREARNAAVDLVVYEERMVVRGFTGAKPNAGKLLGLHLWMSM